MTKKLSKTRLLNLIYLTDNNKIITTQLTKHNIVFYKHMET